MNCGVLALQGDFDAHRKIIEACELKVTLVREPQQLEQIDALVLPGGESTSMIKLLHSVGLWQPLEQYLIAGLPVLATCAGVILLANSIHNYQQQRSFALLDIELERNGYGRQLDSRAVMIEVPLLGTPELPAFLIRAPQIIRWGKTVEVLASYQGKPVLIRQNSILAATFHVELTADLRLHRYFFQQLCQN